MFKSRCQGRGEDKWVSPTMNEELSTKSCPCEYEEVEPCHNACTCRNPVMSGGCQRCCRYGSLEQRVARAKRLVESKILKVNTISSNFAYVGRSKIDGRVR